MYSGSFRNMGRARQVDDVLGNHRSFMAIASLQQATRFAPSPEAIARVTNELAASAYRQARGERVSSIGDDVGAVSAATALQGKIASYREGLKNSAQASSLLEVAQASLTRIRDMLETQRELADTATSSTITTIERNFLNQQFKTLSTDITDIVTNTRFNGENLIDGSLASEDALAVALGGSPEDVAGLSLPSVTTATLYSGATPDLSSTATAGTAVDTLDDALAQIQEALGAVRGAQSRFDTANTTLSNTIVLFDAARGNLIDTDQARESNQSAIAAIKQQTGIAALTQVQRLGNDLLRLL